MKDVFVCRKCGFVSTFRGEFVKVYVDKYEVVYGHECKECNSEAPANIQQQVQADSAITPNSLT